jgi:hypothetical protein
MVPNVHLSEKVCYGLYKANLEKVIIKALNDLVPLKQHILPVPLMHFFVLMESLLSYKLK